MCVRRVNGISVRGGHSSWTMNILSALNFVPFDSKARAAFGAVLWRRGDAALLSLSS